MFFAKSMSAHVLAIASLLLNGCVVTPVKQAAQHVPIDVQAGKDAKPIQFKRVVVKMRRGEKIGDTGVGALCIRSTDLTWRGGRLTLTGDEFTEAFRDELQQANYPIVGNPDALFDDPSEWKAELLVAGLIKSMQANVCYPLAGFGNFSSAKGGAFVKVDWQIYSRLDRKVVHEVSTEGSYQTEEAADGNATTIFVNAFSVAVRNLLADQHFHNLVTSDRTTAAGTAQTAPQFQLSAMQSPFTTPLKDDITRVRAGVVTVFAGNGHGSGFFISGDGYLLTNEHVVRTARFVKIQLATGREILGEVVRTNSRRDVALIKVEERNMPTLPISSNEPSIGADVYAIGTPIDKKLTTTVTKGIISAHRIEDGLRFIQSDVQILPGNSGGPLLDDKGNVVGMAVRGFLASGQAPMGLNFFVPIEEALVVLALRR